MTLRRRAAVWTTVVMVLAVALVLLLARQVAGGALLDAIDDDLRSLATVAPAALGPVGPGHDGPDPGGHGAGGPGAGGPGAGGPGAGGPGLADADRGRSLNELRRLDPRGPRRAVALLGVDGPLQVLAVDGSVDLAAAGLTLPVTAEAAAVARGERSSSLETIEVEDTRLRVLTTSLPAGGAVQLARSLSEVESTLAQLTTRLAVTGVALTVLAGAVALLLSDRLTRPVATLTSTVEHVALTQELDTRVAPEGDDELARLGRAFDHLLGRLEQARATQTQLIADASHELRTPLTSLRTNIDVLRSGTALGAEDHAELLADLDDQLTEFGHLVDGLVELARGEQAPTERTPIHLDVLVPAVVEAAQRDHPAARCRVEAAPTVVDGEARRLTRAVRAVIDNAVVHGGGDVEVAVSPHGAQATVTVRDHGPGIAPQEREQVFDRFYRAPTARSRPGSGLGLAIAEQVVRTHGGSVEVGDTPGGGATVVLRLPAARPAASHDGDQGDAHDDDHGYGHGYGHGA